MANPIKGEVQVVATDGPAQGVYTLLLDFNALCDLEQDFPNIMQGDVAFSKPSDIRRVFKVGFAYHHADLDEQAVGHIIQSIGVAAAAEKLAESMKASFPEAAKGDQGPRKAPAKAGAGSAR